MTQSQDDKIYKWLALMVVVLGTFMAILDSSIVNVAIPKMMTVFGVSTEEIQWVLTAYMLTMGSVIPLTGYLGDTFGTKKVYIWALVAFTIGSAACGFAWSNSTMIVARVIQALGGGMIMPISMAIIYQVIPPEERGTALGIWGIASMAAPAIGPTLSGYIVEHLDWRLIFTINIPVGIVAIILAAILLKESPTKPAEKFDFIGFITSTVGLVSILYVLGEGASVDWSEFKNVFLIMFGAFSLILFVLNELFRDNPLLDLRVLKIWPFSLSIILSSLTSIALFGGIFLMPLYLQNLQGLTPMQTGMIMFPSAIATGIMMPISGKLFDKFGAKPVVIPGLVLLTWSTYELSQISMDTSSSVIMWLLVVRGIGMGLAMMPSTTAGMNTVPGPLVARASALSNVIRQIASSVGLTSLTTVMQHQQAITYAELSEGISSFNNAAMQAQTTLQGLYTASGLGAEAPGMALMNLYGMVQKQATMLSINDTFMISAVIALLTVPLAIFLPKKTAKVQMESGEQPHLMME